MPRDLENLARWKEQYKEKKRIANKLRYEALKSGILEKNRVRYHSKGESRDRTLARQKLRREEKRNELIAYNLDYRKKFPIRQLLTQTKCRAKKFGIPFNLQEEDIVVPTHCPLLGIPLLPKGTTGLRPDGLMTIDKIDPKKGYVKGNVWIISFRANRIKYDASLEELVLITQNLRAKIYGTVS